MRVLVRVALREQPRSERCCVPRAAALREGARSASGLQNRPRFQVGFVERRDETGAAGDFAPYADDAPAPAGAVELPPYQPPADQEDLLGIKGDEDDVADLDAPELAAPPRLRPPPADQRRAGRAGGKEEDWLSVAL